MIKKIILGTLFAGMIGFLIFGAVNRTLAKTTDTRTQTNGGGNYWSAENGELDRESQSSPLEKNQQLNRSENEPLYRNQKDHSESDLDSRNGYNRSETNRGLGNGQGWDDGERPGIPNPQATAGEWAEYQGTVLIADLVMVLVETADGYQIEIEGRAWSYAQEMGFSTALGNQLIVIGFYEDDEFKIASIEDLTTGQSIVTRDQNGRPGWAGNGWGTIRTGDH